jgi:hypothetical protein
MELNIQRQPIAACELLLAATAEHPIECDVLLPDYCPDILRVLDCRATGIVTDAQIKGTAFTVDGMATVMLCYLGQVGGVRKTEYRLPFSRSFELSAPVSDPVYNISVDQGYLNCRAVSPRRLDIRGSLAISVRLWNNERQEAVSDAQGMGVQLRKTKTQGTRVGSQTLRRFSVAEELTPPAGKPPAMEIVRATCKLIPQETKPLAGRAVVKGDMLLHILYKSDVENESLQTADYTLPISQLFEVENAEDSAWCEVQLECISVDCSIVADYGQEEGRIRAEAQIAAMLRVYYPIELSGAVDSYSTLYLCENSARILRIPKMICSVSERAVIREQADAPAEACGVIDAWATASKAGSRFENGALTACCRLTFLVLCAIEDGTVESVTHECEVLVAVSAPGADSQTEFSPRFTVISVNAMLSGKQLQMTAELNVSGVVLGFETRRMLTEISVDENSPNKTDPSVGLIIYYARSGENVWDISKRYGALPKQVMDDNNLESETIAANQAVIIPTA